jgi:hypothetical protein
MFFFFGLELQDFSGNCFCFADWGLMSKETGIIFAGMGHVMTANKIYMIIFEFLTP